MLILENRHNIINTMAMPMAKLMLYMAHNKMNASNIKLPKPVSNKLINKLGTAYIITHNITNKVINPTTKLRFFFDKMLESVIYIYNILFIIK
jgi:hypothetical protein